MRWLHAVANFVIDLVVGDDWLIAVGVAIALGLTWVLATTTAPAWWLLPLAVLGVLALSLVRALRGNR